MTTETIAAPPAALDVPLPRPVRSLVVLGDSGPFGIDDPLPGGGWRGFGPLLHGAVTGTGVPEYSNLSRLGARMAGVRAHQLPDALRLSPDVAVLLVGMNDTLRSDFDPARFRADYEVVVGPLRGAGATVLTVRFHDHTRVFWLPPALARVLRQRIGQVNEVTDAVAAAYRIGCLDLHTMPGGYDRSSWSVDRLHPSERGHRLLARHFGALLERHGYLVPNPVCLDTVDGLEVTRAQRLVWLLVKGVPWLASRGHDLVPYAASIILRDLTRRAGPGRDARFRRRFTGATPSRSS